MLLQGAVALVRFHGPNEAFDDEHEKYADHDAFPTPEENGEKHRDGKWEDGASDEHHQVDPKLGRGMFKRDKMGAGREEGGDENEQPFPTRVQ